MTNFRRALVYLVIFAVVTVLGGLFITNAIIRPVTDVNRVYTADFVNAAGLKVGNDVRARGARIGKVTSIAVHRDDANPASVARVEFELAGDAQVHENSNLAIRYLNLTGIRYVDLQEPEQPGAPVPDDELITTESTTPSFDVTRVFRGLAPVFSAMSTEDINHFTESLLAVVEGDGSSFPQFVSSLTTMMELVDDRSQVINTLVDNLAELAGAVDGRQEYIDPIIGYISRFGTVLAEWTPDLENLANDTGNLLIQADYLLAALGLEPNRTPDADFFVNQIEPINEAVIGLLSLTPGILESINSVVPAPDAQQVDRTCSNGTADLPAEVKLFLRGSQVTLCKR
ncbi:MlaD family protein [Gordonia sp. LSe1-13]|uniref:MlaD family protein n=1 Tax=Gordonia sesuvii TaxID=3116777 RepID=A0ABU7MD22_9ACTN|nr:MlaD family protein [Gordonia sp. LSe1-13]